jgi:hypothetical protein
MHFLAKFWTILAVSLLSLNQVAHAVERTEVPGQYQWDLSALYPSEAAWVTAKQELQKSLPALGEGQGSSATRQRTCWPA